MQCYTYTLYVALYMYMVPRVFMIREVPLYNCAQYFKEMEYRYSQKDYVRTCTVLMLSGSIA